VAHSIGKDQRASYLLPPILSLYRVEWKVLQIRTKSQAVSLAPIIALPAAAKMHRRGIGYYPTEQPAPADNRPMTAEQAETLRRLAKDAYKLDALKRNLTRAEADLRIAALTAKLKLLDEPPHTL
jgi:hypothetical protein